MATNERLRVADSLAGVSAARWNALAGGNGAHARQAVGAATAGKAHENRLRLIAGMVGERQVENPLAPTPLRHQAIPRVSRGGLQGRG